MITGKAGMCNLCDILNLVPFGIEVSVLRPTELWFHVCWQQYLHPSTKTTLLNTGVLQITVKHVESLKVCYFCILINLLNITKLLIIFITGFPSVGKSTLLSTLAGVYSEVAAYEFTTLTTVPGCIKYKGAKIQVRPNRCLHCVTFDSLF